MYAVVYTLRRLHSVLSQGIARKSIEFVRYNHCGGAERHECATKGTRKLEKGKREGEIFAFQLSFLKYTKDFPFLCEIVQKISNRGIFVVSFTPEAIGGEVYFTDCVVSAKWL